MSEPWAERLSQPVELVRQRALPTALDAVGLLPPAFTRLEPQSVSGDPAPGAEARVHDPLWALARQWQLGELHADDAGSPIAVHVDTTTLPLTAWQPGPPADGGWRRWPTGALLDELVEAEPSGLRGLRARAEGGQQLLDQLAEAGADLRDRLVADHPLTLAGAPYDPGHPPPDDALDPQATRLLRLLAPSVPDGDSLAAALRTAPQPGWVSDGLRPVVAGWLAWYDGTPGAADDAECWDSQRLDHAFSVRCGSGADQVVLRAVRFPGGRAGWDDFDAVPGARVDLDGDVAAATPRALTLTATRLRYPGMPADRYWELEDGQVDLAGIEAQPHDLARMCLTEFALVYGDDWLVVPVEAQTGALTRVGEVAYTTTFGERVVVPSTATQREGAFRIFAISTVDGGVLDGLFLPPAAAATVDGHPVEEVLLLRDEVANLAWAVERTVPGRSGDPRSRADEPPVSSDGVAEDATPGDLLYRLRTAVPPYWIPLVPIGVGYARVALRKGAFDDEAGNPILPAGTLLAPTPLTLPDEEVPREGVRLRRVPTLARRGDGSTARWISRRVNVGSGGGSSGLADDSATAYRP